MDIICEISIFFFCRKVWMRVPPQAMTRRHLCPCVRFIIITHPDRSVTVVSCVFFRGFGIFRDHEKCEKCATCTFFFGLNACGCPRGNYVFQTKRHVHVSLDRQQPRGVTSIEDSPNFFTNDQLCLETIWYQWLECQHYKLSGQLIIKRVAWKSSSQYWNFHVLKIGNQFAIAIICHF